MKDFYLKYIKWRICAVLAAVFAPFIVSYIALREFFDENGENFVEMYKDIWHTLKTGEELR